MLSLPRRSNPDRHGSLMLAPSVMEFGHCSCPARPACRISSSRADAFPNAEVSWLGFILSTARRIERFSGVLLISLRPLPDDCQQSGRHVRVANAARGIARVDESRRD